MAKKIEVNDKVYESASAEERKQVHELLVGMKIIGKDDYYAPSAAVPDVNSEAYVSEHPRSFEGFPGNLLDGIGTVLGGPVCDAVCDTAAVTAAAACVAKTAGAGLLLCQATVEAARQECRKHC